MEYRDKPLIISIYKTTTTSKEESVFSLKIHFDEAPKTSVSKKLLFKDFVFPLSARDYCIMATECI